MMASGVPFQVIADKFLSGSKTLKKFLRIYNIELDITTTCLQKKAPNSQRTESVLHDYLASCLQLVET
jgi:hypothetical protein